MRYTHYLGKSKCEFRYGAVVFSTDAPPRWVTLGSAKGIEAALKRYQALVHNPGDEVEMEAILQRLYTEAWEPVEQAFHYKIKPGYQDAKTGLGRGMAEQQRSGEGSVECVSRCSCVDRLNAEGIGLLSEPVMVAQIYATALGGGTSSRLFQEVREKR